MSEALRNLKFTLRVQTSPSTEQEVSTRKSSLRVDFETMKSIHILRIAPQLRRHLFKAATFLKRGSSFF